MIRHFGHKESIFRSSLFTLSTYIINTPFFTMPSCLQHSLLTRNSCFLGRYNDISFTDRSVGRVTRYGVDSLNSTPGSSKALRLVLGLIEPPIQWALGGAWSWQLTYI
jgi:hypothetical protein